MKRKRILVIQDISSVGQCSMSVALPVLAAWGMEVCMLPTMLLSTHTGGYGKPEVLKFTPQLKGFPEHWKSQGIDFDAILTGYLGSMDAIMLACDIADGLLKSEGLLIVDPAMADGGKLYSGLEGDYASAMRSLCQRADILLPNLTEAAILSGKPYREHPNEEELTDILTGLHHPCVILTGVEQTAGQLSLYLWEKGERHRIDHEKIGAACSGTGDLFSACFAGALLRGYEPYDAVSKAAEFTKKSVRYTVQHPDHGIGIQYEEVLPYIMNWK